MKDLKAARVVLVLMVMSTGAHANSSSTVEAKNLAALCSQVNDKGTDVNTVSSQGTASAF